MGVRERLLTGVSRQLGRPEGWRGRLTGRGLNRGNREVVLAAVASTGLRPGQSSADIGFGGGVGLRPLLDLVGPAGHVHGIELSETMLSMARRRFRDEVTRGRLTLQAGDLTDLPLADDSLDAVITVNTLYFVADVERALAEMARVLRPSGTVVIGVGDPTAMQAMPFTAHGFTLRPVDELTAHMRDAGFREIDDQRVGNQERSFHLLVGRQTPR